MSDAVAVWDLAVVGAGPAGLAAAEVAAARGARVLAAERMPTIGRKFLMAGKSGLNLTFDAPVDAFVARYPSGGPQLAPMIAAFGPAAMRDWAEALGQETFVGSSGRVFPRAMKASPLLRAWRARLEAGGVAIRTRWRWRAIDRGPEGWALRFDAPDGARRVRARAVVLALGGASWPRLGSDGQWAETVAPLASVRPFEPSNVGFEANWSEPFRTRFAGEPVKDVALSAAGGPPRRGEFVITGYGVEGSAIYALGPALRAQIAAEGAAVLSLDLAPGRDRAALTAALAKPRGKASRANWLRKAARLQGVKAGLLREGGVPPSDPAALAARIKACPIRLLRPRPIAEAISTAGGLDWAGLDERLMLRRAPGVFAAGEMIDWDAPTGGYLLTACIASGRWAGESAANWVFSGAQAGDSG